MRAMLLDRIAPIETSPLRLAELPLPDPQSGEVRLKVRCCAICRTDLHVIEGDLPQQKIPVIPGHQVVGTVDAVGPDCRRFQLGQRVGVAWLRHTCGTCSYCSRGRENLCESARFTGYHADGGYAEYAVVPEDFAYPIPAMDYQRYVFFERDIHSVTCNTRQDGAELLAEASAIPIRPHTTVYPLRDANRSLQDLKNDRISGTGVLVTA
jgi:D-arabinose 1-dehydrogenase-like Zn-dependent alcohol dehydrogenase